MGIRINTNDIALNAQDTTRRTMQALSKSTTRLASGLRINSAADDAAGLAIAARFNAQAVEAQVDIRNLQSGYNLAETADNGLMQQQESTQRLRELAIQSANGTMSAEDREALNREAQQIIQEINNTSENTRFNGIKVLEEDKEINLTADGKAKVSTTGSSAEELGITSVDLTSEEGARQALTAIDGAIDKLSANRATMGAQMNRMESEINRREVGSVNIEESMSAIRDADMAEISMNRVTNLIKLETGMTMLAQSNMVPQSIMQLLGN